MSAIFLDAHTDDAPRVLAHLDWSEPTIVAHLGRGSMHLNLDQARQLALDILAAIPEPVTP